MASVNPQFSIANVITIILTFVVALTAFNTVEGQVENNKKSIEEAKVASHVVSAFRRRQCDTLDPCMRSCSRHRERPIRQDGSTSSSPSEPLVPNIEALCGVSSVRV